MARQKSAALEAERVELEAEVAALMAEAALGDK